MLARSRSTQNAVVLLFFFSLSPPSVHAEEEFPGFDLSVDCPTSLEAAPGEIIRFPAKVLLRTTPGKTDGSEGARAWSLSLRAGVGARIAGATTARTYADLAPAGLRDDGYEQTELTSGGENGANEGAVSAVILSFSKPISLPATGQAVLLGLVIEVKAPDSGERAVEVSFVDGLKGSGQAVKNVITYGMGITRRDDGGPEDDDEDGYEPCLSVCRVVGTFVRGSVDGDDEVNLTDAIQILGHLFKGAPEPGCLEAADTTGDGEVNLTDAIHLLHHLFRGGPAPVSPYPDCGRGAAGSLLGCAEPGC
ncbi:MAG TPA: dockerin type I repeat-containing protein [Planctomycetota bacterium]|nr:dockerin type I repeat-containing protein [Planctomycetota bacterium]